jgi:hypothetical protein
MTQIVLADEQTSMRDEVSKVIVVVAREES